MLVRGRDLGRIRGRIAVIMLKTKRARRDHTMSCIAKESRGECRIVRTTPSNKSLNVSQSERSASTFHQSCVRPTTY